MNQSTKSKDYENSSKNFTTSKNALKLYLQKVHVSFFFKYYYYYFKVYILFFPVHVLSFFLSVSTSSIFNTSIVLFFSFFDNNNIR